MLDMAAPSELSDAAARARTMLRLTDSGARALAATDAAELSSEDLRDLAGSLEQLRRFLDAAQSHVLVQLDAQGVTELRSGLSTSKWLARRAALPVGAARQRLAVAHRLAALPSVDAALTDGRIGYDHARVLTDVINDRNVDAITPVLDDLIDAAAGTVFGRWRADVTALAALLDPDGSHDPAADLAANTLTLSPSDRFVLGRFELAGERALTVHDTLHAVADELCHQYRKDREQFPELQIPARSTLLALALEEVCRRALAVDRCSTKAPRVEATFTLHTGLSGCGCDCGRHHSAGDPQDPALRAVAWIHNSMGSPLPAATLPSFVCDAAFYAVVVDSLGVATDLGRSARTVSPAQRRALVVRDGGCVFPGCDCPATWTDSHHVREWTRHAGRSDLDNFVLLCRRHHRVAHRHGWTVRLDQDGWTTWTSPTGRSRSGQRHQQQRAGP
jgi:hypothetical protein